jgi:hypothetical protein
MPLVKNVEKRIWDTEEFDVIIRRAGGRDLRGDRTGIPMYPFDRRAKHNMTVAEWIERRFGRTYPGFEVDVLYGDGAPAPGNATLGTVRDTYVED